MNLLRFISLRIKIAFIVSTLVLVGTMILGFLALANLADLMEKQFQHRAEATVWALAHSTMPYLTSLEGLSTDHPTYLAARENMIASKEDFDLVYAGLFLKRDTHTTIPIVDTNPNAAPLYLTPHIPIDTMEFPVFGSSRRGAEPFQVKADGQAYFAGWEPIETEKGYGLALVLISLDELSHTIKRIRNMILIFVLLFTLMAGYTAYRSGSTFERTAMIDGLMGIYNHKYFKQRLEAEVEKSRRYGQQTSVVMVDIDHFKKVNDTYGHQVGDFVLKRMAQIVKEQARKSDIVARYGGEEIGLILPFTSLSGAQQFAERLRMKVEETLFEDREEEVELRITCSLGVAKWEPGMDVADLIRHADQSLYASKHNGRNRVTIYQDGVLVSGVAEPESTS